MAAPAVLSRAEQLDNLKFFLTTCYDSEQLEARAADLLSDIHQIEDQMREHMRKRVEGVLSTNDERNWWERAAFALKVRREQRKAIKKRMRWLATVHFQEVQAERDQFRAECDEFRAALERVCYCVEHARDAFVEPSWEGVARLLAAEARAALNQTEPGICDGSTTPL